jgi:hypothetical protein
MPPRGVQIQPNPLGLSHRTLRSTLASAIREPPLDVGRVRPRVVEKRRECFGQRPASLVEDQSSDYWPLATSMRVPPPWSSRFRESWNASR